MDINFDFKGDPVRRLILLLFLSQLFCDKTFIIIEGEVLTSNLFFVNTVKDLCIIAEYIPLSVCSLRIVFCWLYRLVATFKTICWRKPVLYHSKCVYMWLSLFICENASLMETIFVKKIYCGKISTLLPPLFNSYLLQFSCNFINMSKRLPLLE